MDFAELGPAGWLLLGVLFFCSAAEARAIDVSALTGRWVLKTLDGKEVARAGGEVYFQIGDSMITGFDGCNRFGGSISQPSAIQRGQRGCPADGTVRSLDVSRLAAQLSRAKIEGDELLLPLPNGGEARFRRTQ